jgi:NAD(P) transhydrogenase
MKCNGVTFHGNERVVCTADSGNKVALTRSSNNTFIGDAVLAAAGTKSNTEKLNLPAAGVTANERGLIRIDEHFRTDVPHIYADGDAVGFPALASTSMQQGRLAMQHAFGSDVS